MLKCKNCGGNLIVQGKKIFYLDFKLDENDKLIPIPESEDKSYFDYEFVVVQCYDCGEIFTEDYFYLGSWFDGETPILIEAVK